MTRRTALRRSREIVDSLLPGEEFFALMGRDRGTPDSIRMWAMIWNIEIKMGIRPESDRAQIKEGLDMARRMEIWLRDLTQKREHDDLAFDDRGIPTTGEHARRERNTTSGANDG
jgi:hypothetical protein